MKQLFRRTISLVVALVLLISMTPLSAMAATPITKHDLMFGSSVWYNLYYKSGATWRSWGSYYANLVDYFDFDDGSTGYCIEPFNPTPAVGSDRLVIDWRDIETKWGSGFEFEKQVGITLALAYGAPNNGNTTAAAKFATALVIWDMSTGYRTDNGSLRMGVTPPFAAAIKTSHADVYAEYEALLARLAKHGTVPSFSAGTSSNAPTHTLTYNTSTGLYETALTDTNGVLESFNYQSKISGLTFVKDGNTLNISATPEAAAQLSDGVTFTTRGNQIEVGPDSVLVWTSSAGSDVQLMCTLETEVDPVPSYFKLQAETYGSLEIAKAAEDGKISNIGFTLTAGDGTTKTGVTGSDGKLTFTDLTPGSYTLTEDSYAAYVPQQSQTMTIVSGETTKVTFSNTLRRGNVTVTKEAEDGNVSGKQFRLHGTATCGQSVELYATTNASGKAYFTDVLIGSYTLEEVNTPSYYVAPGSQTVTVEWNQTANASFTNTLKRGDLTVTKAAEDGNVGGKQFRLHGTAICGQTVDLYATTDASGKAVFKDILIGTGYTLEEVNVPSRYVAPSSQTADVTWNGNTEKSFSNVLKKWMATVTKSDKETGSAQGDATLQGAVYGVYQGEELADSYVTDANGQFTTKYYPCGDNWSIREIQPSEGYLLDSTVYHVGAESALYSVELNSTTNAVTEQVSKGKIAIIKHCDDGSTQIETPEVGAEFDIYLKAAGSYAAAEESERDHLVCDENGFAETKLLPYGVYTVRQTKSWDGRELMPAFDVYVTKDGEVYRYLINNASFESYIQVVKEDAETGKTIPYAGSGFQLYDPSGKLVTMTVPYPTPVTIDTFYTDSNGSLVTPEKLPYGKGYSLVEVQAPQGYVLDSTPVYFDVDQIHSGAAGSLNVIRVVRSNVPQKGTLTITKSGEVFSSVTQTDGTYQPVYAVQGLPDAVYEITAAEDIYTLDGTLRAAKGQVVDTVTTGADGTATSKALYLGKYEIRELTAPYGMVLSDDVYSAELAYAGQQIQVTNTSASVTNERQKAAVELTKVLEQDELFGIGMNGEILAVEFGLFAAEDLTAADGSKIPADGLLETASCDETGKVIFTTDIPVGSKLYVKEISTDPHYVASTERYPVTFRYAGQTVATVKLTVQDGAVIENEIIRSTIVGKKLDEDGFAICGALFGLFWEEETDFSEKTALQVSTSNEIGVFSFEDVPYGRWIIREIKPAAAFVANENSYTVTVAQDGAVVEIVIENHFIVGAVQAVKVDAEYQDQKLSGAAFEVYVDVDGNKVFDSNIDLYVGDLRETAQGVYRLEDLRYNGYFLHEKAAPEGYLRDNGYYYFEIREDGKTVTVENKTGSGFVNQPITGEFVITKLDADSKAPLANVGFRGKDAAGNVVAEGVTDENGVVRFTLRYGKYTFEEIAPLEGYQANTTIYTVDIREDGQVLQETVTNSKIVVPPNTGDAAQVGLWLCCSVVALIGIAGILLLKRKKAV